LIKLGILKTGGALGIHQFSRVETENVGTEYPVPIFWRFKKEEKTMVPEKIAGKQLVQVCPFPGLLSIHHLLPFLFVC